MVQLTLNMKSLKEHRNTSCSPYITRNLKEQTEIQLLIEFYSDEQSFIPKNPKTDRTLFLYWAFLLPFHLVSLRGRKAQNNTLNS